MSNSKDARFDSTDAIVGTIAGMMLAGVLVIPFAGMMPIVTLSLCILATGVVCKTFFEDIEAVESGRTKPRRD